MLGAVGEMPVRSGVGSIVSHPGMAMAVAAKQLKKPLTNFIPRYATALSAT